MTHPIARRLLGPLAAAALLIPASARAKIDLSTLPERGDVELTIYNAADLTLVRETRAMSFKEGENLLQFSWANTLIDPTSVHLRIVAGEDFLTIDDISYPANSANTLVWTIQAEEAREGTVEITYFTSGIAWQADYVARANRAETEMALEGYVRVTNNSGEDYLNAKTRLLVGEINLVEGIAYLANLGEIHDSRLFFGARMEMEAPMEEAAGFDSLASMDMPMGGAAGGAAFASAPKDVAKEGVSEYFLFTIEGREDLENQLSKRLPSFDAADVPFTLTYKHDPNRFGYGIVRLYKAVNDKDSNLGDAPLPNGFYQVFGESAAPGGGLAYLGRHDDKYIPIDEDLEINLGSDGLVTFEDVRRRFRREEIHYSSYGDVQGWDEVEEREVVIRNARRAAIPVEILRTFAGDFDFIPADESAWEKLSETERELKATVPPLGEARFAYKTRVRQGSNAKK